MQRGVRGANHQQRRSSAIARYVAALAALPLSLGLVACGSTVQPGVTSDAGGSVTVPGYGDEGLSAPTAVPSVIGAGPTSSSPGSPSSGPAGPSATGVPTTRGSGPSGGRVPGGNGGSSTSIPISAAPSNFKGPIKVGIAVANVAAIAAVFGKPNQDGTLAPKALAAYINSHGGIDGHPIQLVIFEPNSGEDAATADQAACAAWTQDNRIDIALGADDAIATCLAKYGIAAIGGGAFIANDEADLRQHPNVVAPDAITLERSISAEMQVAAQRGVLKRGSKLGVMVEGCPWGAHIVDDTIAPLAKQLGVTVVQSGVQCINNIVTDLAPVASEAQSAVLKFKLAGVTSVMAVSSAEAYVDAQFSGTASSQHFAPTYIASSQVYPYQNTRSGATIRFSPNQELRIFGVGTLPQLDVGPLARPYSKAQAAAQAVCRKANPPLDLSQPSNYFILSGEYVDCDSFFQAKAALEADGLRFDYPDVIRGWQKVVSEGKLPSDAIVGGKYTQGSDGYSQDGVSLVREFEYSAKDGLFHYVGKPFAIR